MYVLSHGCLLSPYKALFNFQTWVCLSCVSTSSVCKCLFVVYSFFLWEASCYKYCLVCHDVFIYYMLDLVDPYGRYYKIPFRSRYRILDIILLELVHSFPFFLAIAGRFCINDVAQQCHIIALCLRPISFFESIIILFFILYYFSNYRHLFFGTSLILLFL